MTTEELFTKYTKYYIPNFYRSVDTVNNYIFCGGQPCYGCKVRVDCKGIDTPLIKKGVVTKYLESHPEHRI